MDSIQGHFIGGSIEITSHPSPKLWVVKIIDSDMSFEELTLSNAKLIALAKLIKSLDLKP